MASFSVKSERFLEELQRRAQQFAGLTQIAALIQVPEELIWWYWVEFGTAAYNGGEGYMITPNNAHNLRFYSRQDQAIHFAHEIFTLGIPPHHMITKIEGDLQEYIRTTVRETLLNTGFDPQVLHQVLIEQIMPEVKRMIVQSFEDNLTNSVRPFGRIDQTPAEMFEQQATIIDQTL
jgi:hypothetical protein